MDVDLVVIVVVIAPLIVASLVSRNDIVNLIDAPWTIKTSLSFVSIAMRPKNARP